MSRLSFFPNGASKSGLTKIWLVKNNNVALGTISWFSNWRRYTFTPLPGTTFDSECQLEIGEMLSLFTHEHNGTEGRS